MRRNNQMLWGLLASSALVAPAVAADMPIKAPMVQNQQVSGYLEMEGGFAWQDNSGSRFDNSYSGSDNKWMVNGAGRVNVWWGRNYSTQFDVWGGFDSFARSNNDNRGVIANVNVGAHFSYRDAQMLYGLFGAVGGIGSNDNCCSGGVGMTHGTFGGEVQYYLGNITLYGQAGIQTNISDVQNGGNYRAWFIRGVGRYFVHDNLKVEAFAAYANGRATSEDFLPTFSVPTNSSISKIDFQQVSWGVGVEKRFTGTAFSGFARYEGNWTELKSFDPNPLFTGHTTEHAFKAGFRVYINEDSLKFNDRNGTTLDIRDPFTSIYRATGRTWNSNGGA